ncbi:hypothetical protein MSG28_013144, partial [Choristoneura fumiferana]
MWLQLARRDPNEISSHSNVFMCEDHFYMEKDTTNYMQHKLGFSKKILLTNEAVPSKFHCQKDRKRLLSDDESAQEVFFKRKRIELVRECLQSQSATETQKESLKKDDDIVQEIIKPEEILRTQDKDTVTDSIITAEKTVQARIKRNSAPNFCLSSSLLYQ